MKHYIKVYWGNEFQAFDLALQEVWNEEEGEDLETYGEYIAREFGGGEERDMLMLISGKFFFICGAGELKFDKVVIGDPEDDSSWIELSDVEFGDESTSYEVLKFLSEDSGNFISVYLDDWKSCEEEGYRLLELGL